MFEAPPRKSAILLLACLLLGGADLSAFTRLGVIKPAVDWQLPHIHAMASFQGRVYFSYGDWGNHPGPLVLTSYDPESNTITAQHLLGTDSLGAMREIGDQLWIPSIDPIHYQGFEDYAVLHGDGHLERRTPVGFLHIFDVIERKDGEIWVMGSKEPNEWESSSGTVFRTTDQGRTWSDASPRAAISRFHWGFEDARGFHVAGFQYGRTWDSVDTWTIGALTEPRLADLFHSVAGSHGQVTCFLADRPPALWFPGAPKALTRISPSGEVLDASVGAHHYTPHGKGAFLLTDESEIQWVEDLSRDLLEPELWWSGGQRFTALHVHEGILYATTVDGELYGKSLTDVPLGAEESKFVSRLPERVGESLCIQGDTLAVGIPSARQDEMLEAGRVEWYEREDAGGPWSLSQVIQLPAGEAHSAGSWFGQRLSIEGQRLVIAEGGRTADGERSKGNRIWCYDKPAYEWTLIRVIEEPFLQSLQLVNGEIFGGARGQLIRYKGEARTASQQDLFHESYSIVAADQSRVYYGSTGDVSRRGAPGTVKVFQLDGNGMEGVEIESPLGSFARFGFSMDVSDSLLAIGAPRADDPCNQAGAVVLYQWRDGSLEEEAILTSPMPGLEYGFGHAVAVIGPEEIYVSEPMADGPYGRRGAVHRFARSEGIWEWQETYYPGFDEPKIWEFGTTLEKDGEGVMVASGQTNEDAPLLDRLISLPREQSAYLRWVNAQGLLGRAGEPLAIHPHSSQANLLEFALGSVAAVSMVPSADGALAQYSRRTASSNGLAYRLEASSDLVTWSILDEIEVESIGEGREVVRTRSVGSMMFVRVAVAFEMLKN